MEVDLLTGADCIAKLTVENLLDDKSENALLLDVAGMQLSRMDVQLAFLQYILFHTLHLFMQIIVHYKQRQPQIALLTQKFILERGFPKVTHGIV